MTTEDRAAVTKSLETITGADTENEQATYLKNLIPVYTGGTPYGTSNKTEKMEKAADANRAYMANVPDSSYKELIGETVNHFTVAAFDRLENLSHQKGFGGLTALMGEIGSGDISASSFYHLLPGTGNKAVQEDQQFYERQVDKFLNNKEWINNLNSSGFTNYDDQVGVTREFVSALTYAGIGNNTASRETLSILQNLEYNNLGSFGKAGSQGYVASPAVNSQPASTGHVSPLSGGLRISGGDRNGKAGADNDKGDSDSTGGTPPISLTH